MTDLPTKNNDVYESADPEAAAQETTHAEPVATEEEKDIVRQAGSSGDSASDYGKEEEKRPNLAQTKSYATTASALSVPEPVIAQERKWYKTNPFKWGKVAPVPEKREVSREYNAGFFSKLTFQWMAPLMKVC
jgi:ATP-binding cassette subfamily C (CFTR/MRP) protein 1